MKDRVIRLLIVIFLMYLILDIAMRLNVEAQETDNNLIKMRCTVYCDSGITKSGQPTRDGICAMNDDMLGKVACVYRWNADGSVGEFIGYYEVLDTGGNAELKAGNRIDIYKHDMVECNDWIAEYGDYVYIQLIEGRG